MPDFLDFYVSDGAILQLNYNVCNNKRHLIPETRIIICELGLDFDEDDYGKLDQ